MGHQFEQITLSPHRSLSFIVDDMNRARRDGLTYRQTDWATLEAWLNVLQDWSAPLVHSVAGRRGIERWLETVASDEAAGDASAAA